MKTNCLRSLIVFLLIFSAFPVYAQITLDGTLGNAGKLNLSGPDYNIKADYGQQAGANLFHSFQHFNINTRESATFSGPDSVQNIISRVTGGNISLIDGTLRSAIPGANMYLLNSAGVMFGANASLDLSGSFYVSTADYLRLGENEKFFAEPLKNEMLSVAEPTAFGFLDNDIAPVTVEGKGELTTEVWDQEYESWWEWRDNNPDFAPGLAVPAGKSLSVIGGDIEIKGTYFQYEDAADGYKTEAVGANLSAPQGRIFMTSAGSAGEVEISGDISGDNGEISAVTSGNISLSNGAKLTVNGPSGAGSISIRGGMFVSDNYSQILSEPLHEDGGVIDIQADKVLLQNGSRISADTEGTGKGSDIRITGSEEVSIISSQIKNGSFYYEDRGAGDGGLLSIKTKRFSISTDSWLGGESYGTGKGGDIAVEASESARVSDYALIATSAKEWSTGQAGNITVNSPSLTVETGAVVESRSEGPGKGGNIAVNTKTLEITSGGKLSTQALQSGHGGNLSVSGPDPASHEDAADSVRLAGDDSGMNTGIYAGTSGTGNAGAISVTAKEMSVTDKASVATSASDKGNAGAITLNVGKLDLSKGAAIASASIYPETKVYTVADPSELEGLSGVAKTGDIVIVQDAGDGKSAAAILDVGDYWVQMTGEIFTVDTLSELDGLIDYTNPEDGEGNIVLVRNAGNGESASFVYSGFFSWLKLSNICTVSDLKQRNEFPAFPGDVARVDTGAGTPANFTYTGEKWIPYGNVSTVADLSERDNLSARTGDVAKVADAGNGAGKSFIFDGEKWADFYMTGNAGTVAVHADDAVTLKDDATLTVATTGGVHAGEICLEARSLELNDSASISSVSHSVGDAGTIRIRTENDLSLNDSSAVTTATFGQGKGGDIEAEASDIAINNSAAISSASRSPGKGGDAGTVTIRAGGVAGMSDESSVSTSTEGQGKAGDISIEVSNLKLDDKSSVSSESHATENGGAAGTITLSAADSLRLLGDSALTTEAKGAGGGKIFVNAGNEIYLLNGGITSSVKQGEGKGGDVTTNSKFVILNSGDITANAEDGDGGAIFIRTDNYIRSSGSKVTATSKRGNDGTVKIEAPDTDVSKDITVLPVSYIDVTRWMQKPCLQRTGEKTSHFVIEGRDAVAISYDDWLPSPIMRFGASNPETQKSGPLIKDRQENRK